MISQQTPPSLHWQHQLGSTGLVVSQWDDIAQSLHIIATTPIGAVPLMPLFGSDAWRYIDWPITRAIPHLVRVLTNAWHRWEPRVRIQKITPTATANGVQMRVSCVLTDGTQEIGDIIVPGGRV